MLRLAPKDQVEVFDGEGLWAKGYISEIRKKQKAIIKTTEENFDQNIHLH